MAGKATSVYVQIIEQATHKTVERKTFFNSKGANEYLTSEEVTKKYPKPEFYYHKDTY